MISTDLLNSTDSLNKIYHSSVPFPFVVMENFLTPHLAELILQECRRFKDYDYEGKFISDKTWGQERKEFMPSAIDTYNDETKEQMKTAMPLTWHTINYLNSNKVLNFLSKITDIPNLEGDPNFMGGGVHKISSGGFLDVHTDYDINWFIKRRRQLNLLIYLNPDWQDYYNGNLELWDRDLTNCQVQVRPLFNRAILFNTTGLAYHGHPIPLNTPEGISRYSLALYYYLDNVKDGEQTKTVDFQRPVNAREIKDSPVI